jgi:polyisoprenyl-phosphate glycosyltransferase
MEKVVTFVIPVYNSEKTIGEVVNRILTLYSKKFSLEIILVNDCSKDNTANVCRELCKKHSNIKFISLAKNFGQHGAIMAGLRFVEGDYVVLLDDDMQTPPEEVVHLLSTVESNPEVDVVFGARKEYKQTPIRKMYSKLNIFIFRIMMDLDKDLELSNFLLMKKYIVDEIVKYDGPFPFIQGLILRTAKNIVHVFVEHKQREVGQSNYSFVKLLKLWANGITNFSIKPLRLATFSGSFLALIGLVFALALVIEKLINPAVAIGWTSIMVTLIFFSGVQLISIGMFGEYIGRVFIYQNKTPQYVIKEKINTETN